ncbi:MAG: GNAT family N-acetyltransferase [Comamonadaceae bacterium]|nr:GNAT family N-acetyltransferase [Comamonadaceae bacterium]
MWAVEERASGALVGRVGFLDPPDWPGCELGWSLAREHWGKGYAFEAALAARRFGREQLGVAEPISLIRADNQRSIALAKRLGAIYDAGEITPPGSPAQCWRHPVREPPGS